MDEFERRFYAKRSAGLSAVRRDGTFYDPETDRQGGHAEAFAARQLGAEANCEVYGSRGDGGCDFTIRLRPFGGKVVEVGVESIWNGFRSGSRTEPRTGGNLLLNPGEPWRYSRSDIFLLVVGSVERGFGLAGWCTVAEVRKRPPRDFGNGPRYWVPVGDLRPIDDLVGMLVREG